MPWLEVGKEAWKSAPGSLWNAATAIPHAVMNPGETWSAMKQLGSGVASKAQGWAGYDQDPAQKARDEAGLNAVAEPFTSVAGLKKSLATDPFTVLSIAAIPLSGGASLAGAGAKAAETLGAGAGAVNALGAAGKGLGIASKVVDPSAAVLSGAQKVAGALGALPGAAAQRATAVTTGVPAAAFRTAYDAGSATDPVLRQAFNDFATGSGKAEDLSEAARNALAGIKNDARTAWGKSKEALTGAATQDVDFAPIAQAWQDAKGKLSPRSLALDPAAHDALDAAGQKIVARANLPSGDPARTLFGVDQLKQDLWQEAQSHPAGSQARNALLQLHAGTKEALNATAPQYQKLMESYQGLQDNLQNLTKSLGTGDRVAANAEMRKLLGAQKTPQGQQLINQLAQKDPRLPYMIAGSAVNPHIAVGGSGLIEKGSLPFHAWNVGSSLVHAASTGDFNPLIAASGAAMGQTTVQSPHFMAGVNYRAGQAARTGAPAATALSSVHQPVRELLHAADPAQDSEPRELVVHPNRPAHARGGKVGHQHLVDRLFRHVERAKREEKAHTSALLNQPDTAIAKALNAAQKAI